MSSAAAAARGGLAQKERIKPTAIRGAAEVAAWDAEADVVVVGLGCAGACAAIEAADAGAEVLVLERAGGGGGTSALSGGLIYLGGGTPVQKACGFDDTPEEMFKFLMAACGPDPDEAKVRIFCEGSVEHFHWLEAQGVPFKRTFYPEPGMEAPTDDCLVFSGGEETWPFSEIARPAPRAHKPQANAAAGGFLMQRLVAAVERRRVRIAPNARVETLVQDAEKRVVGCVVWRDGREWLVGARRGVVLTAGGFIKNREMVERHAPLLLRPKWKIGVDGDDGRAIRMGMAAGGALRRMDAGEVAVPLTPPLRLMRGVLVNAQGQRFINEDTYYGRVGQESLLGQDGRIWLIVDDATYEVNQAGMQATHVAETPAELESEVGLPEGSLQSTLALYNRHAERGQDPVFHKRRELVTPLVAPPYAAIDCGVERAIYVTFTLGGLATRPSGEVLSPDGVAVPGLFAAGRTTCGIAAPGYASGISLGDGTFFGRLAGRSAAQASREAPATL